MGHHVVGLGISGFLLFGYAQVLLGAFRPIMVGIVIHPKVQILTPLGYSFGCYYAGMLRNEGIGTKDTD